MTDGCRAVVIGASSGGVMAILRILSFLPATFAVPVVIVQHISDRSAEAFVSVFQHESLAPVEEAQDKDFPKAGHVYLAPPGYHLLFERDGSFSLSVDELVNYSRPSIDVLFESAAACFGPDLIGVILTGSNHDGAAGMRAIRVAGGRVIIQDPSSAESPSMPQAALAKVTPDHLFDIDQVGSYLENILTACSEVSA